MKTVCVFCASSVGSNPAFTLAAEKLGATLAARKLTLVYGGGNIGLMGILADAVLARGGNVVGVIPQFLMAKELGHLALTELKIVSSMHERKAVMEQLSDGFIALPGGFGTLEEFCEILTWGQLGLHAKPFGLLNTAKFYEHFLKFLDHAVDEGLLKAKHRALVLEDTAPEALLERMAEWKPVRRQPKWIDRAEET